MTPDMEADSLSEFSDNTQDGAGIERAVAILASLAARLEYRAGHGPAVLQIGAQGVYDGRWQGNQFLLVPALAFNPCRAAGKVRLL